MIGWLLRLFGIGRPKGPASGPARAAAQPAGPKVPPAQSLPPEAFKLERRKVIAYVGRARVPIRQAATARQLWIADLSKVYEAIRTSPTQLILEKAGEVGFKHEPAFRDALMLAQSLEPPPSCESAHAGLIGWLTSLHSACLSLIDARRLKDRSLLGSFREHLSQARRHAAQLAAERARLFVDYQLKVRPSINRRRPRAAGDEGAADTADQHAAADEVRASRQPTPATRRGQGGTKGGAKRPAARASAATRPPRVRAASGAQPPPRRRTG